MERIILHSDLNNFYASVERKLNKDLVGKPVAVCGSQEERKGIVLAKSEEAKKFGVKTGDTVWQAKKKCPDIVVVKPHFGEYMEYSRAVKQIYANYTDRIESFGIDECWLDVTKSTRIFPEYNGNKYTLFNGEKYYSDDYLRFIGDVIRNRVKQEVGLTVSVGVSYNKVFAKLGSDLKKPDGTSVVSKLNYKSVIYPLPVEDLLLVGSATNKKLRALGLGTIGRLASATEDVMRVALGKTGLTLLKYARGEDDAEVMLLNENAPLKSIGNSLTYAEDLHDYDKVNRRLLVLAESVAARLRESGSGKADTVHLWVRDEALNNFTFQRKVRRTALCQEIAAHAFALFHENFTPPFSVRALGITVSGFSGDNEQLTFDEVAGDYSKREAVEKCVDKIRKKYGYASVQRGSIIVDCEEAHNDIKNSHLIKPARFDDGNGKTKQ